MLILTFVLLRCVLSRNNACLLELEVHHRQAHDVCMHWKVLKPPRSGVATIKKVMTTLSMPQEEDPDDQWEWDEDAQVWISATVAKGQGSPKSNVKCHLFGRRGHMAKQ